MLREAELTQVWYGDKRPGLALRALALLYGSAMTLRRWLYANHWLRSTRLRVPVIVVGNLSVGGTGKTPLTLSLVEALRERGLRPGVISRGYGGSATAPQRVTVQSEPDVVGDEPYLIHDRCGVPLAVARDRVAAAQLLLDGAGQIDCLIADDGLQHLRLARDIEICVVDGRRRFGNGRLLPAGPLREPVARLQRVDFLVCNGGETPAGEVRMDLRLGDAVSLNGAPVRALQTFAGQSVHAVAGIGNPSRFFDSLRACGLTIREHAFPDHHAFVPADLAFGATAPIVMTEKDAVKCRAFAPPDSWYVPVTAQLPSEFFDALAQRLAATSN